MTHDISHLHNEASFKAGVNHITDNNSSRISGGYRALSELCHTTAQSCHISDLTDAYEESSRACVSYLDVYPWISHISVHNILIYILQDATPLTHVDCIWFIDALFSENKKKTWQQIMNSRLVHLWGEGIRVSDDLISVFKAIWIDHSLISWLFWDPENSW